MDRSEVDCTKFLVMPSLYCHCVHWLYMEIIIHNYNYKLQQWCAQHFPGGGYFQSSVSIQHINLPLLMAKRWLFLSRCGTNHHRPVWAHPCIQYMCSPSLLLDCTVHPLHPLVQVPSGSPLAQRNKTSIDSSTKTSRLSIKPSSLTSTATIRTLKSPRGG